jgi:predicted ester cyclase
MQQYQQQQAGYPAKNDLERVALLWPEVIYNQRNLNVADQVFAPECQVKGEAIDGSLLTGADAIKTYISQQFSAFPDFRVNILSLGTDLSQRMVFCRFNFLGTFTSPIARLPSVSPTGRKGYSEGLVILQFHPTDARIVSADMSINSPMLMATLGIPLATMEPIWAANAPANIPPEIKSQLGPAPQQQQQQAGLPGQPQSQLGQQQQQGVGSMGGADAAAKQQQHGVGGWLQSHLPHRA